MSRKEETGGFASADLTMGQMNAIVKKLGGRERALKFLRGDLKVCEQAYTYWYEEDGIIYFSVTSDGTNGTDWIARLEGDGTHVSDDAKDILCSAHFKPTTGITTEIAVFRAAFFGKQALSMSKVHDEANKRGFGKPNAEVACLIREKFANRTIRDMWISGCITVLHEPAKDCVLKLLSVDVSAGAYFGAAPELDGEMDLGRHNAFAFAVTQASAQST